MMRGFLSPLAVLLGIILFSGIAAAACASGVLEGSDEVAGQRPTERRDFRARCHLELKPDLDQIDPSRDLHYWWSAPKEWATQRVVQIEAITPKPDSSTIDPQNGNLIYFWDLSKQNEAVVDVTFSWRALAVHREIEPARITSFDPEDEILQGYLKSDNLIQAATDLRRCALEMVHDKENPYDQAKVFYDWLKEHPGHRYPLEGRCAEILAERMDTRERPENVDRLYALFFCALCRAAGIPARPVWGFLTIPGRGILHTWAEFYASPYGWVPVDFIATDVAKSELISQLGAPDDPDFYFGSLDCCRLILSKGTDIELRPASPVQNAGDLIVDGRAAYLQLGVWNREKIPDYEYKFSVLQATESSPNLPVGREATE